MKRVVLGLLAFGSLALIGGGVWMLHPPAALIVVGALVWVDLHTKGPRQERKGPQPPV